MAEIESTTMQDIFLTDSVNSLKDYGFDSFPRFEKDMIFSCSSYSSQSCKVFLHKSIFHVFNVELDSLLLDNCKVDWNKFFENQNHSTTGYNLKIMCEFLVRAIAQRKGELKTILEIEISRFFKIFVGVLCIPCYWEMKYSFYLGMRALNPLIILKEEEKEELTKFFDSHSITAQVLMMLLTFCGNFQGNITYDAVINHMMQEILENNNNYNNNNNNNNGIRKNEEIQIQSDFGFG